MKCLRDVTIFLPSVEYATLDADSDDMIVFGIVGKIAMKNWLAEVKCARWGFVWFIQPYLIERDREKVQGCFEVRIRQLAVDRS